MQDTFFDKADDGAGTTGLISHVSDCRHAISLTKHNDASCPQPKQAFITITGWRCKGRNGSPMLAGSRHSGRAKVLFGLDHVWEVYKLAHRWKFGYYMLPML